MKNSLLLYCMTMGALICVLMSCNENTSDSLFWPRNPDSVKVEVNLKTNEMITRTPDEDLIDDVNIHLFGAQENYHFYYPEYERPLVLEVLPGSYSFYVTANVHENMGSMTKKEIEEYRFSSMNMTKDLPMIACVNVNILGETKLPALELTRAAAKIAYTISVDPVVASSIKLRSVQFCNIPYTSNLYGFGESLTDDSNFFDDDPIYIGNGVTYSDAYYLLENCQGEVESITDQKDKTSENAPIRASYMRILADGPGKLLEYIVFLGENSTSDFNVRKGTKYVMELTINGDNEIDNRVRVYEGLYYGEANSYICTGTQISFDVTPCRTSKNLRHRYTGIFAGVEYVPHNATILWQDTKGLVKSVSLKGTTVTVNTSGGRGNAVIAIYGQPDELLWSFHIWCTDMPKVCDIPTNMYGRSFTVLDRNLGATTTSLGLQTSYGLIYQWGRKDPFVGADAISSTTDAPMYSSNGGLFNIIFDRTGIARTIEEVVHNPQTFYCDKGFAGDWFNTNDETYHSLWGDEKEWEPRNIDEEHPNTKTVYDPCPKGYKVPAPDFLLITSKTQNFWASQQTGSASDKYVANYYTYSAFNLGWRFYVDGKGTDATKIISLPCGGFRLPYPPSNYKRKSGELFSVGTEGCYWASGYMKGYNIGGGTVIGSQSISHTGKSSRYGMNVRCVKE